MVNVAVQSMWVSRQLFSPLVVLCWATVVLFDGQTTFAFNPGTDGRAHRAHGGGAGQQHPPKHRSSTTPPLHISATLRIPKPGDQGYSFGNNNKQQQPSASDNVDVVKRRVKRKYKRKRSIPETEQQLSRMKAQWEADYQKLIRRAAVQGDECPSIWSFESLFPEAVLDEDSVKRDLYSAREQDALITNKRINNKGSQPAAAAGAKMKSSFYGGPSMMRIWREPRTSSAYLPDDTAAADPAAATPATTAAQVPSTRQPAAANSTNALASILATTAATMEAPVTNTAVWTPTNATARVVDRDLTRLVEDSMYGYRRTRDGAFQYETSLMGDGAVQFRDGVRLGKPLRVNADRLTYLAKKELQHGRVEEAQEMYERAIIIDPQDGRAYLGLSRCAERRRDFTLARECLRAGITHSLTRSSGDGLEDRGANPFLLQALGCLEEKMGHLSEAEALYISAAKSRPWHAASWVALAQLRTRKLGQSAEAGRVLFQSAERELRRAGKRQSSHVYTAWASLEYHKAGDIRRARQLFKEALKIDKKCSAAYLQLGVMEAADGRWDEAQQCFDKVLTFDQRNSRVLQAYAIMETKRPGGNSRKAIGLFERALKANSRDAGVLQPYALYVAQLGNIEAARGLLRRATKVNKRHAAVWQAWGVMEMNEGNSEQARSIFQQGIWACAQLAGGQSGGYRCARLWQAWGLLEAREGDHAAARRCFSRALDADTRNVATVTAWALMEEGLGNIGDARSILERALRQFSAGSEAKKGLWLTYEQMERRIGNLKEAQRVYQRSMRETLTKTEVSGTTGPSASTNVRVPDASELKVSRSEVEVVRWDGGSSSSFGGGEVWMNDRAIESKVPQSQRKKRQMASHKKR